MVCCGTVWYGMVGYSRVWPCTSDVSLKLALEAAPCVNVSLKQILISFHTNSYDEQSRHVSVFIIKGGKQFEVVYSRYIYHEGSHC